ncbi:MAG: glucose-6-phosphate isomerase [Verrucomicrobiota bacterium]
MTQAQLWKRFQQYYTEFPELGLAVDLSRMNFPDDFFARMAPAMHQAYDAMTELERGAIANPDEKRQVGHYWLRNAALAPDPNVAKEITDTVAAVKAFAKQVHDGSLSGARGPFKNLLVVGIGGSALGPQFVANALGHPTTDKLDVFFFDNTDPDGMDKVLGRIVTELGQTLCVVISKSGGTKETRNGMVEAKAAWEHAGLDFARHAVAVTGAGSELDKASTHWLARFPMWDWVGGRTSETSAVGLLPAALQGLDIDAFLAGAKACDSLTRLPDTSRNPAAQLALMWHYAGSGRGARDLVVLPYKDRLELFSKYLQQLIMESLGKALDCQGKTVNQGLAVYGNKGSTDQHAYVQQLRDGLNNFFVTFIEVLRDRQGVSMVVETGATSGDYLSGFFLGTRRALHENDRESITLTIAEVSPFTVGVLIALFERAVGFYASLININAYHQPGVEAGKKAAGEVLALQGRILCQLATKLPQSVEQIAQAIHAPTEMETIFKVCEHLAANPDRGIQKLTGKNILETRYQQA